MRIRTEYALFNNVTEATAMADNARALGAMVYVESHDDIYSVQCDFYLYGEVK